MAEQFITDLVLQHIYLHLLDRMQKKVAVSDLSYARVVKTGRFQENPIDAGVYVAINPGDPSDPTLMDANSSFRSQRDLIGVDPPGYEVGGGQFWWRSIRIQFGCFYITNQLTEAQAQTKAMTVLGRLLHALDEISGLGITDSWGESALALYTYGNTLFESGGPPDQYIWRGTVSLMFLTARPHGGIQ